MHCQMKLWYSLSVPLAEKDNVARRSGLCDKHNMFPDLQADNAIDFADFTDFIDFTPCAGAVCL